MTAGRDRCPRPRDGGVTVVIGAIMMTAILLAAIVVYQLTFVPVKGENAEAAHMTEVQKQLAAIKADLDRQIENRTLAPLANPVTMGRPAVAWLGPSVVPATLQFEPGTRPVQVRLPKFIKGSLSGDSDGDGPLDSRPPEWPDVTTTGTSVEGVWGVINFRLFIGAMESQEINSCQDMPSVSVTLADAAGAAAGDFSVYLEDVGADPLMKLRTRDADGDSLYDNAFNVHSSAGFAETWIDLLNDDYRFDRVISAAAKPLSITLVSVPGDCPLDAEFTITYLQEAPGGGLIVVGTSTPALDTNPRFAGGALRFTSDNAYFVDQEFVLENGALVLDQGVNEAFAVRPAFSIERDNGLNAIAVDITLPSLVGTQASVTSLGLASVYTRTDGQAYTVGRAPGFSIEIITDYPALWQDHWEDQLLLAGLEDEGCALVPRAETCNYEIGPGGATGSLKLTVHGTTVVDADPAAPVYDLFVIMRQANVRLELK